jgi:hypothetical protein
MSTTENGIDKLKAKSTRPSFEAVIRAAIPYMENDLNVAKMPVKSGDGEGPALDIFGIYAARILSKSLGAAFPGLSSHFSEAAYKALKLRYVKGSDLTATLCGNGWQGTFEDLITEVKKAAAREMDRDPYNPGPITPGAYGRDI